MENKLAIHCPTKELWDKVQEKAFSEGMEWREEEQSLAEQCNWSHVLVGKYSKYLDACTDTSSTLNNDYTIIPAEEWLAEGKGKWKYNAEKDVWLAEEVVIGSQWKNKTSERVHTIISVDDRGWYLSDIGGNSPKSGYIKNFTYVGMRELKVGDRAEVVVKSGGMYPKGYTGKISSFNDHDSNYCHINNQGACVPISHIKLIESEDSMKDGFEKLNYDLAHNNREEEYSVPLREGDEVRVVDYCISSRNGTEATIIDGYKGNFDYLVKDNMGDSQPMSKKNLELIPTEKDIVVGSVWESIYSYGDKPREVKEVVGFNEHGFLMKGIDIPWSGDHKHNFLRKHKLIHRGDEESKMELFTEEQQAKVVKLIDDAYKRAYKKATGGKELPTCEEILTKTNKKEKKMKTKVISVGLDIMDKYCSNLGKVVYFDEDGNVAYKEADGKVTVGKIGDIILAPVSVILPKPKPVAKKKVTKKKKK